MQFCFLQIHVKQNTVEFLIPVLYSCGTELQLKYSKVKKYKKRHLQAQFNPCAVILFCERYT